MADVSDMVFMVLWLRQHFHTPWILYVTEHGVAEHAYTWKLWITLRHAGCNMQGITDQIICICMSSLKDHNGSANKGKRGHSLQNCAPCYSVDGLGAKTRVWNWNSALEVHSCFMWDHLQICHSCGFAPSMLLIRAADRCNAVEWDTQLSIGGLAVLDKHTMNIGYYVASVIKAVTGWMGWISQLEHVHDKHAWEQCSVSYIILHVPDLWSGCRSSSTRQPMWGLLTLTQ